MGSNVSRSDARLNLISSLHMGQSTTIFSYPGYFYAHRSHRLAWRSIIICPNDLCHSERRCSGLIIPILRYSFSASKFSISVLLSTTGTERPSGISEKYCFAPSPPYNRRSYRPRRSGPQRISNLSPRSSHPSEFILTVSQSVDRRAGSAPIGAVKPLIWLIPRVKKACLTTPRMRGSASRRPRRGWRWSQRAAVPARHERPHPSPPARRPLRRP